MRRDLQPSEQDTIVVAPLLFPTIEQRGTSMSYLDLPRLHFAGTFREGSSMIVEKIFNDIRLGLRENVGNVKCCSPPFTTPSSKRH